MDTPQKEDINSKEDGASVNTFHTILRKCEMFFYLFQIVKYTTDTEVDVFKSIFIFIPLLYNRRGKLPTTSSIIIMFFNLTIKII